MLCGAVHCVQNVFETALTKPMTHLVELERECPSCGLDVPEDAEICPFCQYEFPELSTARKGMAWVFALLLLLPVLYILNRLFS